jgi:hypothetical protein
LSMSGLSPLLTAVDVYSREIILDMFVLTFELTFLWQISLHIFSWLPFHLLNLVYWIIQQQIKNLSRVTYLWQHSEERFVRQNLFDQHWHWLLLTFSLFHSARLHTPLLGKLLNILNNFKIYFTDLDLSSFVIQLKFGRENVIAFWKQAKIPLHSRNHLSEKIFPWILGKDHRIYHHFKE